MWLFLRYAKLLSVEISHQLMALPNTVCWLEIERRAGSKSSQSIGRRERELIRDSPAHVLYMYVCICARCRGPPVVLIIWQLGGVHHRRRKQASLIPATTPEIYHHERNKKRGAWRTDERPNWFFQDAQDSWFLVSRYLKKLWCHMRVVCLGMNKGSLFTTLVCVMGMVVERFLLFHLIHLGLFWVIFCVLCLHH
jgi:hypothetical protein